MSYSNLIHILFFYFDTKKIPFILYQCSNHKMSLEQLYSYYISWHPSPFWRNPSPFGFVVYTVCLFVFRSTKEFPNMRLKLNVKLSVFVSSVCVFVCVCVWHIYLLLAAGENERQQRQQSSHNLHNLCLIQVKLSVALSEDDKRVLQLYYSFI